MVNFSTTFPSKWYMIFKLYTKMQKENLVHFPNLKCTSLHAILPKTNFQQFSIQKVISKVTCMLTKIFLLCNLVQPNNQKGPQVHRYGIYNECQQKRTVTILFYLRRQSILLFNILTLFSMPTSCIPSIMFAIFVIFISAPCL